MLKCTLRHRLPSAPGSVRRALGRAALVVSAMVAAGVGVAAQPGNPSLPQDSDQLQEVVVTASKLPRQTLKRLATQFAESHGAEDPVVHQIGRWRADVCPRVSGLQPAVNAFVSRRVTEVARRVGAPTGKVGKACTVNVVIVFTLQPQQLLDHFATDYPSFLGSSRSAGDTKFQHAIQSWYVTGTNVMNGWTPPIDLAALMIELQNGVDESTPAHALAADGARVDPAYGVGFAGFGNGGSYFTKGFMSELLQVFIIVDSSKVAGDSLSSISDYISMLALTRVGSLDGCSDLPSITDLLSSGCGNRQRPLALTETDTAYLKSLYSSDLEKNLNLEQGDIRDRMVTEITGR
jgi:hypothetical protein